MDGLVGINLPNAAASGSDGDVADAPCYHSGVSSDYNPGAISDALFGLDHDPSPTLSSTAAVSSPGVGGGFHGNHERSPLGQNVRGATANPKFESISLFDSIISSPSQAAVKSGPASDTRVRSASDQSGLLSLDDDDGGVTIDTDVPTNDYTPSGNALRSIIANRIYYSNPYRALYVFMIVSNTFVVAFTLFGGGFPQTIWWILLEVGINSLFFLEISLRLVAQCKNFWKSFANVFDFVIMVLCVLVLFAYLGGPSAWEEAEQASDAVLLATRYVLQYLRLLSSLKSCSVFRGKPKGAGSIDFSPVWTGLDEDDEEFQSPVELSLTSLSHMGAAGLADADEFGDQDADLAALDLHLEQSGYGTPTVDQRVAPV